MVLLGTMAALVEAVCRFVQGAQHVRNTELAKPAYVRRSDRHGSGRTMLTRAQRTRRTRPPQRAAPASCPRHQPRRPACHLPRRLLVRAARPTGGCLEVTQTLRVGLLGGHHTGCTRRPRPSSFQSMPRGANGARPWARVQGTDLSGLRVAGHRMVAAGVCAAVIASAGVEAATIFQ